MGDGELQLGTPIEQVPGVGATRARALSALGITNLGRLVAHLPMRHERLEAEATIADLLKLPSNAIVSARGEVSATRIVMRGRRPRFEAVIMDPTGRLDLVWFNQLYLRDRIHPGLTIRVQGKARRFGYGLQMANPTFVVVDAEDAPVTDARLRPVYPASEAITSRQIESILAPLLPRVLPLIEDHLPEPYRRERSMPALAEAYRMMHAPDEEEEVKAGRRRLAYDELLLLQLGVALKRRQLRETLRAPALRCTPAIDAHIRERFPFQLTSSQDSVIADLVKDLSSPTPTNRLIQGDVGSGKTIVALYAMLLAVASEQQAAIMAPTEILAEQHHASMSRMLKGSRVRIELLTGSTPQAQRESILRRVAAGEVDILVGTHAVITERVSFASLAVAVIDEQHRFGVHQRAALRTKGERTASAGEPALTPHVIVMTATPIPRTLAITLFGDLDISTIAGLPPGRTPIATRLVGPEKRGEVYAWLRTRLDAGEQAYIVVPAIESDGSLKEEDDQTSGPDAKPPGSPEPPAIMDVRTIMKRLETGELAGKRLAAVHGRLKSDTRDHVMERFRSGLIDALIATTVIEVGVDVPTATIMIIEQAERFGLAQLHQLRGRVGRGSKKSACILISDLPTGEAQQRLEIMTSVSDGFVLAEKDLELRGPGELFGTRQSGLAPLKVADLARDLDLLKLARRDASDWIARSPHLDQPGEALIRRRLLKAYGTWFDLGDVG